MAVIELLKENADLLGKFEGACEEQFVIELRR